MTKISFFSRVLDLIAPRACAVCGRRLSITEEPLCATCNMALPRTNCHFQPLDNEVAQLFWGRIPIEKCAAYFFYKPNSASSYLIYKLKYFDRPDIGEQFGRLIAAEYATQNFFDGITALLPVPLTKRRTIQRGYNQSLEIAHGVSAVTGIPILKNTIKRTSFVDSQTQKDMWERTKNVENAFKLCTPEKINNQHILLIDDIITTGATLTAVGKELMKASNVKISILALGVASDK